MFFLCASGIFPDEARIKCELLMFGFGANILLDVSVRDLPETFQLLMMMIMNNVTAIGDNCWDGMIKVCK